MELANDFCFVGRQRSLITIYKIGAKGRDHSSRLLCGLRVPYRNILCDLLPRRIPYPYHIIPLSLRRDWTMSQSLGIILSIVSRIDSTAENEVPMNRPTAS